ncbi:MAG: hypothetical protein ACMXYD_02965 [Candidatus Woesearchaeota archaeon]
MSGQQTLWGRDEEVGVNVIKKISYQEKLRQEKEKKKQRLQERITLSDEELNFYSQQLKKENIEGFINNYNLFAKQFYKQEHMPELVSIDGSGMPTRIMRITTEYTNKQPEKLLVSDLATLCRTIEHLEETGVRNLLPKFRKANNLSSFGLSQYQIMSEYLLFYELEQTK